MKQVWLLRRMTAMIAEDSPTATEVTERVLERMAKTQNNQEFLTNLTKDS